MRLGSLAGIEVRAHYSSLFVFGALVAIIAEGYLPLVTPAASEPERIAVAALVSLLFGASILAHEFGHAIVARRRGKRVPMISLHLFGGAAQIQSEGMTPSDEVAIAIAGPLVSTILAIAFLGAGVAAWSSHVQAGVLLLDIGIANAALALFNLLPGFPMDGGRVLRGIIWKATGNVILATKRAAWAGRVIGYLTVAFGCLLVVRGQAFFGGWAAIMGWFLLGLTAQYYKSTILRVALEGLTVRDLCASNLPTLQTSDTVAAASRCFGIGSKSRSLAVLFGDRPAGVVTDVEVARAPAEDAAERTVAAVMTRIADLPVLDASVPAPALLEVLPLTSAGAVLVAGDGGAEYVGLVRREDITRYVEMVEELGNCSAANAKSLRGLAQRSPKPAYRKPATS